jgi:hypothetical protein
MPFKKLGFVHYQKNWRQHNRRTRNFPVRRIKMFDKQLFVPGHSTMQSSRSQPTFQRDITAPSSGLNNKPIQHPVCAYYSLPGLLTFWPWIWSQHSPRNVSWPQKTELLKCIWFAETNRNKSSETAGIKALLTKAQFSYRFHIVTLQRRIRLSRWPVVRCGIDVVWRVQVAIGRVPRSTITLPEKPFSRRPAECAATHPRRFVRTVDSWGQLRWTVARWRPSYRGSQPLMLMRMWWWVVQVYGWRCDGGFVMMGRRREAIFTVTALRPAFVAEWEWQVVTMAPMVMVMVQVIWRNQSASRSILTIIILKLPTHSDGYKTKLNTQLFILLWTVLQCCESQDWRSSML